MDVRVVRSLGLAGFCALIAGCGGSPTTPGGHGGPGTTSLSSVGQSVTFLDSAHFNTDLNLVAGGQYLIAVVNTATTASASESFTLSGTYSSSGASRVASNPMRAMRRATALPTGAHSLEAGLMGKRVQALRRMQNNHMKMLERDNQVFQNFAQARAARSFNRPRMSISQTVGQVNKIYIAKEFGATCSDVDSIGARTVAVGQHVIVLADTNTSTTTNGASVWPDSLRPDSSFYQTFANEYDAITYPHILNYIGNPLAFDTALSNTGKITVVISPVLNHFGGGIVAFVDGCDFNTFTPSGNQMSLDNQTEVFYYWTPDPADGWTATDSAPFWQELMRATAAHETKHIVSFTDRIILNNFNVPELIWLEEGLAQESSEIWERNFNQATWKGHANFNQTVACELSFGGQSPCDAAGTKPIALLGSHLPFLFDYLEEETPNPVGHGLGTDTPSNYGAGWEFARWATDQYGSSEAAFIKSLVNEGSLNGLPNMAAKTGKSIPELLVYWSLATAIIDTATYTASDVRTTIPSFNFGDIFHVGQSELTCNGVPCGLFTNSGLPVYPVAPDSVTAGTINAAVTVPGTAAAYFLLSAPNGGSEQLQLQSGSGGTLSPSSALRVGIIRVQ